MSVSNGIIISLVLNVAAFLLSTPSLVFGQDQAEQEPGGGPCAGRDNFKQSQGMEVFGISEPSEDPWGEYNQVMLLGKFREFIECADRAELLVPYDRDNQGHFRKRKSGKTKREDLILFGDKVEYFRYILPTAELNEGQFSRAKALLLGPNAYLEFGSGPKFSGIISGPRSVLRFSCGNVRILVTVSQINLPSIWFSGGGLQPFGGLLHPEIESRWHQIFEEAIKAKSQE